jgi:hypothetical protein
MGSPDDSSFAASFEREPMRLPMQILTITIITNNTTPPATPPPIAAAGNIFDAANDAIAMLEFATLVVNKREYICNVKLVSMLIVPKRVALEVADACSDDSVDAVDINRLCGSDDDVVIISNVVAAGAAPAVVGVVSGAGVVPPIVVVSVVAFVDGINAPVVVVRAIAEVVVVVIDIVGVNVVVVVGQA